MLAVWMNPLGDGHIWRIKGTTTADGASEPHYAVPSASCAAASRTGRISDAHTLLCSWHPTGSKPANSSWMACCMSEEGFL